MRATRVPTGRAQRPEWFPTGRSRRLLATRDGERWVLDGTVHARRIGHPSTACGVVVTEWPVLFVEPFAPLDDASCRDCKQAIWRVHAPPREGSADVRSKPLKGTVR